MPDQRTAKQIYLAVEKVAGGKPDVKGFPNVVVENEGDRWSVSRMPSPSPRYDGHSGGIVLSVGGGQLQLKINKCDGAISEAAFSR